MLAMNSRRRTFLRLAVKAALPSNPEAQDAHDWESGNRARRGHDWMQVLRSIPDDTGFWNPALDGCPRSLCQGRREAGRR